jgi:hypothetical protein
MDISKVKTGQLLLIIGIIILFLPPILTRATLIELFDYSDTGQIGDTISGITAPFINAIGAILVFFAFKEQIRANELIKEQLLFQYIIEDFHRLEDNYIGISEITDVIKKDILDSKNSINNYENGRQISYYIDSAILNKAIYLTTVFQYTMQLIENLKNNKEFMINRLQVLFQMLYQESFCTIRIDLESQKNLKCSSESYIHELIAQINVIETSLIHYKTE